MSYTVDALRGSAHRGPLVLTLEYGGHDNAPWVQTAYEPTAQVLKDINS